MSHEVVGEGACRGSTAVWLLHGELPLEAFMPRCSLSVHHAGAGTCSCALRAAAPQLLCTVLFDQLGWAERVVYLGVGERLHFDLPAHATDSSRQEESKETFRLLERNIADVGLGSRVCRRLLALGERSGTRVLSYYPQMPGDSTFHPATKWEQRNAFSEERRAELYESQGC